MGQKEFIYSLEKILSEDVPLDYEAREIRGELAISVSVPNDLEGFSMNLSMDYLYVSPVSMLGYYNVEWISHGKTLKDFGRFNDPHKAADKIEEYVNSRFGDILDKREGLDYRYCLELKDFLEYNNIFVNTHGFKEGPVLYIDDDPFTITVVFSEYRGSVFVTVNEDYESSREELYRSKLDKGSEKKVFSDILSLVKNAKPWFYGYLVDNKE